MLYVELQRTQNGVAETRRFGPFKEVVYGGFEDAQLLCDGKPFFDHIGQFMAIALRGANAPDGAPDLWDKAVITAG